MSAPIVMVLGTAASVGKSTMVATWCYIAARRDIRVASFKSQNLSNNAAVTINDGKIGCSTAMQTVVERIKRAFLVVRRAKFALHWTSALINTKHANNCTAS